MILKAVIKKTGPMFTFLLNLTILIFQKYFRPVKFLIRML